VPFVGVHVVAMLSRVARMLSMVSDVDAGRGGLVGNIAEITFSAIPVASLMRARCAG
jgi:hypothetical protein